MIELTLDEFASLLFTRHCRAINNYEFIYVDDDFKEVVNEQIVWKIGKYVLNIKVKE